ncbi:WD domain-containing protein, partial [Aureobasidium melanogenum]
STYQPFLFFYLRALWTGRTSDEEVPMSRAERMKLQQQVEEGRLLVEQYGDLAVTLFAQYNRELLMDFLRSSTSYTYEKASHICEEKHYIPELVYLLSKTGQTKRALFLIIGELGDVSQAISFTKENPDLWDDLLDYSMDKPKFIRALLEEVGTSINPITVVRRIPNGLEIEGLREGIGKMIREYEIQHSISDGVAKVLRGEVTSGMDVLRAGQKKAVKFEVTHEKLDEVEVHADPVPIINGDNMDADGTDRSPKPGHCVGCKEAFHQDERETLIGFNCGHVFHLSCLLNLNTEENQADVKRLQGQKLSEDEEPIDTGRSVRAKVEHAHQIKRAVQGGCPVCTLPDESD